VIAALGLRKWFLITIVTSTLTTTSLAEVVRVYNRQNVQQAIREAKPGTRISIAPGEYRGGLTFENLKGTADHPIVIEAMDPTKKPVFVGGSSGMHFIRPQYVELRDLIFKKATDNGLNIDDGGNSEDAANHLLLENLTVADVGPSGNHDGIKLSGVENFRVKNCRIERWGNGGSAVDMVGCHDGEIVGCQFHFNSKVLATGVQNKGGTSNIVIRNCRFNHVGTRAVNIGGSTGRAYFRPLDAGYEAKNITVEDNEFIGSMSPIAFVGVDGAIVRYNTIYRPKTWVFRILQESRDTDFVACRNGKFTNNIIAFRSDEIRSIGNVGGGTSPETFKFANNHWFCINDPDRSERLNLPVNEQGGVYGLDPLFRDAETGGLQLLPQSPVADAGVRRMAERSR